MKILTAHCYSDGILRRIRNMLAPNGSNNNAPAITVVGSVTGTVVEVQPGPLEPLQFMRVSSTS